MSSSRKSSGPTTRRNKNIRSAGPTVRIINQQRRDALPTAWLRRVAHHAMARLKISGPGTFVIAFLDAPTMRHLNRRFAGHPGLTDVLSFRYEGEPTIGEVIISPAFARAYAARHGLSYRQELGRYLLHGLLHWVGHGDGTERQRRRMRAWEDELLKTCGGTRTHEHSAYG